jgi:T5SS/PEP-CTERM-associated repeat protein
LACAPAARADDIFFGVANGSFTAPASWVGGIPPTSSDRALINNGGTATLATSAAVDRLYLGSNTGTSGTMVMSAGSTLDLTSADLRVGDLGAGTFTMNGGTINHGDLSNAAAGDLQIGRSGNGAFTMTGGTINAGGSIRVARGAAATATATLTMSGDAAINAGDGIVVGRGDAFAATGTFTIGGTATFISGNSRGDGAPAGTQGEGFFSVANLTNATGHVTVKENAVVKTLRLTGRQGHGDITIQDNGKFFVVNSLGALGGGPSVLYGSYLGGGSDSNGDGSNGNTGLYTLTIKGSGLLDIDANNFGRDNNRPELQGFQLARGNSTANAFVQDNATMIVRQRFVIGGLGGGGVNLNGFDGQPNGGTNPGGTATVTVSGGLLSTDHLIVGGSGTGTLTATGGVVETKPYFATNDPSIGSTTTSVDSIRIGMLAGSTGTLNVGGNAKVSTGADLGIGQYGSGTLRVTGGAASIQAKDVFVQKFTGSTGKVIAEITGATHTTIKATNDVTINGGSFALTATALSPTGAFRWTILQADSDNDAQGALTGRFDTTTLPAGTDPALRRWSKYYTDKTFVVGLTRTGDANYDGLVNFNDLVLLAQHYNGTGQWPDGDFTDDGMIDFNDLVGLAQNYNTTPPPAAPVGASADFSADLTRAFAAAVPEPSVAALIAAAACGLALSARGRRARRPKEPESFTASSARQASPGL